MLYMMIIIDVCPDSSETLMLYKSLTYFLIKMTDEQIKWVKAHRNHSKRF